MRERIGRGGRGCVIIFQRKTTEEYRDGVVIQRKGDDQEMSETMNSKRILSQTNNIPVL
jgi:hypothetical protein